MVRGYGGARRAAGGRSGQADSAALGRTANSSDDLGRDLVERFRSGDAGAVREVYNRYAGPVFTVAQAALGNRELAAEAVQTTFLKAWRACQHFDTSRELGPWLYAIARRVAVDIWRKERRPTQSGHEEEIDVAVVPLSIEQTWETWEVRNALAGLPLDERKVVHMTHYLGMSQTQIADRLEIPLGTVKSRAYRAHRRLAGALHHLTEVSA
ncbi:MAG: sigma-70 family RNA polymerase sigma factor [Nitriliruptorales bacterium]|nr:sigma-70 family RNA polymerase sigma factor [Nitriliruptorales bacterium]